MQYLNFFDYFRFVVKFIHFVKFLLNYFNKHINKKILILTINYKIAIRNQ